MQVNRHSLAFGLVVVLLAAPAFAASHKVPAEPIYKVDSVTATTSEGKLVVTARGAAKSGGWTKPRLRPKPSKDAHIMAFEFVAVPPPPDAAVIQALVPVEAKSVTPRRGAGISAIRVESESNDAITELPEEKQDQ